MKKTIPILLIALFVLAGCVCEEVETKEDPGIIMEPTVKPVSFGEVSIIDTFIDKEEIQSIKTKTYYKPQAVKELHYDYWWKCNDVGYCVDRDGNTFSLPTAI